VLAFRCLTIFIIDLSLNLILVYLFKQYQSRKEAVNSSSVVIYRLSATNNASLSIAGKQNSMSKERAENNVTKMVAVLSSISILHQVILNVNFFVTWRVGGVTSSSAVSIFVSNFTSVLRHTSNFMIFFAFSNIFKAELRRMYQLIKRCFISVCS
jgi:hypothetical protein